MKAKTLFISFFACLMLCYGNLVMADGLPAGADEMPLTVNINEADAKTLAKMLDGIGMKKARDIIAYREKNGRFYLAEELAAVKGIGHTTVLKNEDVIVVK